MLESPLIIYCVNNLKIEKLYIFLKTRGRNYLDKGRHVRNDNFDTGLLNNINIIINNIGDIYYRTTVAN